MPINISTSTAIFPWRPACWLHVSGCDAASFLQGQLTNDLRIAEQEGAVYGLWLTLKGKVLADSFVVRGAQPNEFWVGSYFCGAAVIRERIESFVIADDVVVSDATNEWSAVSIFDVDTTPWHIGGVSTGVVFDGRRSRERNLEWVFPSSAAETVRAQLGGARELAPDEVARRRIAAGIPAVPVDIGPADLPNEAGLEADAISYTKGCYLGQEVMARLKSMGQVRRRLLRVVGSSGDIPPLPVPLFAGARQVGELRSAVKDGRGGWIGLAMVSLLHVAPGAELAFAAEGLPVLRVADAS